MIYMCACVQLTRRASAFGHPAAARWILCRAKVHCHDPVAAIDTQHILRLAVAPRNAQACKVLQYVEHQKSIMSRTLLEHTTLANLVL